MSEEHEEYEVEYRIGGFIFPIILFLIGLFMSVFFYNIIPGLAILGMLLILSSMFALFIIFARYTAARAVVEQFKRSERERKLREALRKAGIEPEEMEE